MSRAASRFGGSCVLVTGASGGVGLEIVRCFAREGATAILVGRNLSVLRALARQCRDLGSVASCYRVDLTDEDQIRALADKVQRKYGGIDVLVHSAGVITMAGVSDAKLSDFDLQYLCNVRAPFALTQFLLPCLLKRRGQVVFINSTAGLQAGAGVSQYAATKHALKALADSLREEVNAKGVRVLSIYLGRTATPMQALVHKSEGKDYHPAELIQPSQVAKVVLDAVALGREAEITDLRIRPMQKPRQPKSSTAQVSQA